MLRWPFTLYAPWRTRLLMELVVAAVGACREPVTSPSRSEKLRLTSGSASV